VGGSFHDFTATHTQGRRSRLLVEPPDDWGPCALASWARRLGAGAGFECEAWDLVHLARVIDAIYRREPRSADRTPAPAHPALVIS
ncbi:MAG TPA: gfo/Idh/MocA family oxidoreductase, partial [Planctomycetota bacterium]|nr:gfo/Idh/MocA family oxidoreductase [Planctomycetota bacterium]